MKTSAIRHHEPAWHILDAKDFVLGRLSTQAANLLRGKLKPEFVNNWDCGDHVVVINAAAITLTGNKLDQKKYYRHSGYPGGLKTVSAGTLMEENPAKVIEHAVKGMLPKTKLQNEWLKRLHVYEGAEHPHQANIAGAK